MKQVQLVDPATIVVPSVSGVAKIAKVAFDGGDLGSLWKQMTSVFASHMAGADVCEPGDGLSQVQTDADILRAIEEKKSAVQEMCGALMDMCLIDQLTANTERGMSLQAQALEICRVYQIPARRSPAGLRVLGFATADIINANIPIEFLIEDSDITLYLLYLVPGKPLPPIPDHDVAIVLVAESEKALPLLSELETLATDWPRPVLNPPRLVPQMGREVLHRILAPIAGIEIPATIRLDRSTLAGLCTDSVGESDVASLLPDGRFPLIVRPVDSHAGHGLARIDAPFELASYLAQHTEEAFYMSRFVDYRGEDGRYRKYRIMVIDGVAYPSHMAVSDHWMVHYLNAGMLESAEKRQEEERFLDRFNQEFGLRHGVAITEMANRIQLDYFGIDCSETRDGNLLVFEASTALVVHNMDDPAVFPYKGAHMHAFFKAFQALLHRKPTRIRNLSSPASVYGTAC